METMSIFDILYPQYKITKPIRLIELFGGYGSQHFALEYLNANYEHYKLVEWAVKSIQAYKDGHYKNDITDYSNPFTTKEVVQVLVDRNISMNYSEPMTEKQIVAKGEVWCRNVYNNIKATKNIVDIKQTKAEDLEIGETDKYEYIMTYSFPCQDLSLAGLRKGMADTTTRSGMLWEVERILGECKELPQILLMENVPQVIESANVNHFNKWVSRLNELGYKSYHQNLIATDHGIPQTRNRTFMVSILGDYSYSFPIPKELKLTLKDLLENEVDEKYFLSDKAIQGMLNTTYETGKYENRVQKDMCSTLCARDYKDPKCVEVERVDFRHDEGIREKSNPECCTTITTKSSGISGMPLIRYNKKQELCNKLIQDNMVQEYDVIKHSYTESRSNGDRAICESNNISPTLDTRSDCLGVVVKSNTLKGYDIATKGDSINLSMPNSKTRRGRVGHGVAQTLMTQSEQATVLDNLRIRKLTPKECFRLMGVKDEDYELIAKNQSNSSLYHLAGDSIVVDVLMAIFKNLIE